MKTYIFDIDGTLADCSHRLHFIEGEKKDWDAFFAACDMDTPISDVIEVARTLGNLGSGASIIYCTGRPERVREKTASWLRSHRLPFSDQIVMRRDGDHRPDTQAKRELMDKILADGDTIAGVFEDRPSVVRVWREMGLTVFQMTDKEF